jgi:hypothetical protein
MFLFMTFFVYKYEDEMLDMYKTDWKFMDKSDIAIECSKRW